MADQVIQIPFPIKGVNRNFARSAQPPLTCNHMTNVHVRDHESGRIRGAQREGVSKFDSTQLAGRVQHLFQVSRPAVETIPTTAISLDMSTGPLVTDKIKTCLFATLDASEKTKTHYFDFGFPAHMDAEDNPTALPCETDAEMTADGPSMDSGYPAPQLPAGMRWMETNRSLGDSLTISWDCRFRKGVSWGGVGAATLCLGTVDGDSLWLRINLYPDTSDATYSTIDYFSTSLELLTDDGWESVDDSHLHAGYWGGGPSESVSPSLSRFVLSVVSTPEGLGILLDGQQIWYYAWSVLHPGLTVDISRIGFDMLLGTPGNALLWPVSISATGVLADAPAVPDYSGRATYWGCVAGSTLYSAKAGEALQSRATGLGGNITSAAIDGKLYIADSGEHIRVLTLETGAVENLAGADENSVPPTGAKLVAAWRGRLLAVREDDAHNIYASKQGNPQDWDYSPATINAQQAWVLNGGEPSGSIGRPIRALIPWTDDRLVVGTDSDIYELRGDPAAGGYVATITNTIGVWGQNAWCLDPQGGLWFYGSGAIYRMTPGGAPESILTDRVRDWLAMFNRARYLVQLQWDTYRGGLWMFVTSALSADPPALHLFYDATADAVEFHQFPAAIGPTASLVFDGDGLKDRYLLLGGDDGYVRKLDPEVLDDDGTAVSSYVDFAPVKPFGEGAQGLLIETELSMATTTTGAILSVRTGNSIEDATPKTPVTIQEVTVGKRQKRIRTRARGETFIFRLANEKLNKTWSMETLTARFQPAGRVL